MPWTILPLPEGALCLETDRYDPALIFVLLLLTLQYTLHHIEEGSMPGSGTGLRTATYASTFYVRCGIFTGSLGSRFFIR